MLWMVRAFPDEKDRMEDFLEGNIIAVHWGIGDLTGCTTQKAVRTIVDQANLEPRQASLKTGLLFRFLSKMEVGHHFIVPYKDVFYTGIIKSNYYFDANSHGFEHQRKVEWLFEGKAFDRKELPIELQQSIKTKLGLADMSQHQSKFIEYLNKKRGISIPEEKSNTNFSTEFDLNSLIVDAMNIIKDEINSDDPDRRLKAAIAVMELSNKKSDH